MKRKRHACQFCSENSLKQKWGYRRLEYNEQDKSPEIDANRFSFGLQADAIFHPIPRSTK